MEALGAATPTDRGSLTGATKNGTTGGEIVRWLLKLGRLREFRLAIRLAQDSSEVEDVEREAAMRGGAAARSGGWRPGADTYCQLQTTPQLSRSAPAKPE